MPHQDVLHVGWAVARALDFAHEKGVVHRAVKPSNVMIANDGRILLMDFGLALAIDEGSEGEILGTARYVAPEQAQRLADAVPQSDLYSLGVMLYEMLTGDLSAGDRCL
jgi:eukaryotic-like serine/threonine-protein kinase